MSEAELVENASGIEANWAAAAMMFAERHWLLLTGLSDAKQMKVTSADAELYAAFRAAFPSMAVDTVDEDEMKSPEGKARWRALLDGVVKGYVGEDYNFGTLLRVSAKGEYVDENTTLVPRGQFYAIEVARNVEGFNDALA